jgi:hypothetical protein
MFRMHTCIHDFLQVDPPFIRSRSTHTSYTSIHSFLSTCAFLYSPIFLMLLPLFIICVSQHWTVPLPSLTIHDFARDSPICISPLVFYLRLYSPPFLFIFSSFLSCFDLSSFILQSAVLPFSHFQPTLFSPTHTYTRSVCKTPNFSCCS